MATHKAGEEFEFESNNAQMTAKGVNKAGCLNFDMSDEEKWHRVEGFVEDWMRKSKRDIHVKLLICFRKMREIMNNERVEMSGNERKVSVEF